MRSAYYVLSYTLLTATDFVKILDVIELLFCVTGVRLDWLGVSRQKIHEYALLAMFIYLLKYCRNSV